MKKTWSKPVIGNLSIKETEDGVCPMYSPLGSRSLAELAPYCECAKCDGYKGFEDEKIPVNQPCQFKGLLNPKCSA